MQQTVNVDNKQMNRKELLQFNQSVQQLFGFLCLSVWMFLFSLQAKLLLRHKLVTASSKHWQ